MKVNVYDWSKRITNGQSRYDLMSEEHTEITRELGLHSASDGKTYFTAWIKANGKREIMMEVGWDWRGKIYAEIINPPKTGMTADQLQEAIKFYQKVLDVLAEHGLIAL